MANHDINRISRALRDDMRLVNLYGLISAYGDEEAAIWLENGEEHTLTFNDYAKMTRDYAAFLRDAVGAEEGAYVAIAMDTCKEWFPTFWGVIQAGYNALLVDASLSDEMTNYLLAQSGAKAIITPKKRVLPEGVKLIDTENLFAARRAPTDFTPVFGDQVALCTSGTTGTSRIFVYNGRAVIEQVLSSELLYKAQKRIVENEHRRSLAFLPYHHVFGFMANLMWINFLGYSNIYLPNRTPQAILEAAQQCKPELLIAVPLLANNFCIGLQKNLSRQSAFKRGMFKTLKAVSLGVQSVAPGFGLTLAEKALFKSVDAKLLGTNIKVIILGGSHTPAEHLRTLNALGYYTICGFGMTETAVTSVETSLNLRKRVSGSVGKPLSNVEYRVTPGEKHGRRGEMLIRGNSLHSGRLIDGRLMPPDTLEGGWYPTGDVVRLEKGDRMFVEGRCKDVI
ncbi:MAG: AMP-binding protein, partial [Eubacteriales bacterium]|nr:AMP-binding protein [Eubacteriales bacterium]